MSEGTKNLKGGKKMRYRNAVKFVVMLVLMIAVAVLNGCSKKTDTVTSTETSTQSEIENIINQNETIFNTEAEESSETEAYAALLPAGEAQYVSAYYVEGATATLPAAWYRKKWGRSTRNININEQGDTATVTITTNWTGRLYVDTTFDHKRNPGYKPIADTGVKKAYFEKIYGIWTLKKIACVDHNLTDMSKQTVDITQVEATGGGSTYSITDPANLMSLDTELPTFSPGTQVEVVVTVTNTKQEWNPSVFVYLHHGVPWSHYRQLMYDDGTHGDDVAGDMKYTGIYTIGSSSETYRSVFIDVLDSGCLQNETADDYNSTAWRIPYKVQ